MRMNDQWWFTTREGDMGPYQSREDAEAAVTTYIASQQFVEEQISEAKQKLRAKNKNDKKNHKKKSHEKHEADNNNQNKRGAKISEA